MPYFDKDDARHRLDDITVQWRNPALADTALGRKMGRTADGVDEVLHNAFDNAFEDAPAGEARCLLPDIFFLGVEMALRHPDWVQAWKVLEAQRDAELGDELEPGDDQAGVFLVNEIVYENPL